MAGDAELGRRALDALTDRGVPFAVLHDADRLQQATGAISDIDLITTATPNTLVRALADSGVAWPVIFWPYDEGAASILFVDAEHRGLHLDVLLPRSAQNGGWLGIDFPKLWASVVTGGRWPVLRRDAEDWYRASKDFYKGRPYQLHETTSAPAARWPGESVLTGRRHQELTRGRQTQLALARQSFARAARLASRVKAPLAVWLHSTGSYPDMRSAFGGLFPRYARVEGPTLAVVPRLLVATRTPALIHTSDESPAAAASFAMMTPIVASGSLVQLEDAMISVARDRGMPCEYWLTQFDHQKRDR